MPFTKSLNFSVLLFSLSIEKKWVSLFMSKKLRYHYKFQKHKQKVCNARTAMLGRIWQVEYQKSDSISLGVCKVFSVIISAPWIEDVSCFSPYAPQLAYFPLYQSSPSKPRRRTGSLASRKAVMLSCHPHRSGCPSGSQEWNSWPICKSYHV